MGTKTGTSSTVLLYMRFDPDADDDPDLEQASSGDPAHWVFMIAEGQKKKKMKGKRKRITACITVLYNVAPVLWNGKRKRKAKKR